MRTMLISEFKATCIRTLKDVQRTRRPLQVTLRGKPLVTIRPADALPQGKALGRLRGHMVVKRNLVRSDSSADWEMLR